MKLGKIDRLKIVEEHVYKGQKGEYIDFVLHDNKNGTDDYGNDGFITQSVSKEARAAGIKGPIIGNWRNIHTANQGPARTPVTKQGKVTGPASNNPADDSEVPF